VCIRKYVNAIYNLSNMQKQVVFPTAVRIVLRTHSDIPSVCVLKDSKVGIK
jgi:hypothetical protein